MLEDNPFGTSRTRRSSLYGQLPVERPQTAHGERPRTAGRPYSSSHRHSASIHSFGGMNLPFQNHQRPSTVRDVDSELDPEPPKSAWSALGELRERIRRLNMESDVDVDGDDECGTTTTDSGATETAAEVTAADSSSEELASLQSNRGSPIDHSEEMIDIEMSLGRLKNLDVDLHESLFNVYEEMATLCHLPGHAGLSQHISNNLVALSSFCKILEKKLEIYAIKRVHRKSVVHSQGYSSSSPSQSPYRPVTPARVPRSVSVRSVSSVSPAELGTPSYARRLAAHNRRQKSMSMSPQNEF